MQLGDCADGGVRLALQPLHALPAKVLAASRRLPDERARFEKIPERLRGQLFPYQAEGVRFVLRHGGRALIGDEMGLGKTVQVPPCPCHFVRTVPMLHPCCVSAAPGHSDTA